MTSKAPATVTLVTGATKGIGRAIAERLSADGGHVVGLARGADPTFPGDLVQCDMLNPDHLAAALSDIVRRFEFDGLVNGFGMVERANISDISRRQLETLFQANLYSAIACTQALLPQFLQKGRGRIVNIGSRALLGRPGSSIYSAAKAALVGLSRSWALELAAKGITVNVVAPGTTDTDGFRRTNPPNTPDRPASEPATPDWARIVPMQRIGEPREIAAAVCYFLSEDAAYTTGQVVYVCGGLSVGAVMA
jgi:3-oxoacyl-[acyl-carrier protein] reductase